MNDSARGRWPLAVLLCAGLFSESAFAAGAFSLAWKSVKDAGYGFASGVTDTDEPAAAYFNPAGLAFLPHASLLAGATAVRTESRFTGEAWRGAVSDPGDANYLIIGGNGGNPGGSNPPLPDLYYGQRYSERLAWGAGLNADGMSYQYPADWKGRYHGIETIMTLPGLYGSLGYKATADLAIGLGFIAQGLESRFYDDVDLGATIERMAAQECSGWVGDGGAIALLPAAPSLTCEAIVPRGKLGGRYDFSNVMEVDGAAFGWNLGFLWRPWPATRLGLSYRSAIRHRLKGVAVRDRFGPGYDGAPGWDADELRNDPDLAPLRTLLDANAAATGEPGFDQMLVDRAMEASASGEVRATATIPETVSLGLRHGFSDRWELVLAGGWTRWSRLSEFTVRYTDGREPFSQRIGLENAFLYSLGVQHRWSRRLALRAGVAFEDGPKTPERRSARAPNGPRRYFNLGLGYQWSRRLGFDLAASGLEFRGGAVRNVSESSGNVIEGRIDGHRALAIGARLRWEWR